MSLSDLKEAARQRLPDGTRRMVVLVGSGLNMGARSDRSSPATSWNGLLGLVASILTEEGAAPPGALPESTIAQWETMLRAVAAGREDRAGDAEKTLQRAVVKALRSYERSAADHPLYRRALDWGLRDLISFNFDRSLVYAAGQTQLSHRRTPSWRRALEARTQRTLSSDLSLYRRHEVARDAGTLRIWYPHGDTGRADTLKLGVHAYGRAIDGLEHAVRAYHHHRSHHTGDRWLDHVRDLPEASLSWPTQFLAAPVLYLGLGLSHEEWPLWWLLHRRARLHARLDVAERPGTWTLVSHKKDEKDGLAPQLRGNPGCLEPIVCADHPAVWDTVEDLFSD